MRLRGMTTIKKDVIILSLNLFRVCFWLISRGVNGYNKEVFMALRNSVKPFMKGFWDGFFSIATWSNPPKSDAAERFKELLKPIECGSFEDDLRNWCRDGESLRRDGERLFGDLIYSREEPEQQGPRNKKS